jgi:hypothetical protein
MFIHAQYFDVVFLNLGLEFGNGTSRLHEKVAEEAIVQVDIGFSGPVKKFTRKVLDLLVKLKF